MPALRVILIASIISLLAAGPLVFPAFGGGSSSGLLLAYAAQAAGLTSGDEVRQRHPEKDADQKNRNDNHGDNNNNGNGNDNGGDNNSNDNNDNGGGNGNGNSGGGASSSPSQASGPAGGGGGGSGAGPSACSTPGRESVFSSADGKVMVRVFANMSRSIRIVVDKPIDPATVPAVPGQKVDDLLFRIRAEDCNGGSVAPLPNEVNLGVHYTDGDVGGLNESNFKIAWLDQSGGSAGTWKDAQKQANDPPANYVSATITDIGYYVVHQP